MRAAGSPGQGGRNSGLKLKVEAASPQIPEIPTAFVGYRHAGARVHITSEALGRKGAARLITGAVPLHPGMHCAINP